jgi:hypothetical protein
MDQSTRQLAADEMPIAGDRSCSLELPRNTGAGGYITFDEFVRRVPLSASTIRRRLKDGSIPYAQPGGRGHSVLIREDALDISGQVKPAGSLKQAGADQSMKIPEAALSIAVQTEQVKLSGPSPKWLANTKWRT